MIESIQQNFLQPLGLLALLGLIPLIIFYLVKPNPKEEVMPSMTFFREEKKEGKVRRAFRKLKRNKVLLLHILFIVLSAIAMANPLVSGLESDGETVIVLDSSASVNDNKQHVQDFALGHLGERNTVIKAGEDSEILLTDDSVEKARQVIQNHEVEAEGTDLVSAIQLASNYPGRMVIASDMMHTNTDQNLKPVIEDLAAERELKVMDIDQENSHGFTGLKVEEGVAEVTVLNYLDRNRSITVKKPGENRDISIGASSTKTIKLDLGSGTHELILPLDEFAMDNKLYVSIPEKKSIEISYLGETSKYFKKAISLIEFTDLKQEFRQDADVYYISDDYEIDNQLEELMRDSEAFFIIEARSEMSNIDLVKNYSGTSKRQVEVSNGLATSFTSSVNSYDVTGEPLASPEEAFVLSEDENVLLYNVEDDDFGKKITYPIFWKKILQRMTDLKKGEQLNIQTGQNYNFESPVNFKGQQLEGNTGIDSAGFYRGKHVYSANFINPSEASPHLNRISSSKNVGENPDRDPAQKYLLALLAFIATIELIYLSRRGEIS
ncbi:MAG: BatA and WFA domain-containing protein [Candidatus Nanohaloarchaea archaeon]